VSPEKHSAPARRAVVRRAAEVLYPHLVPQAVLKASFESARLPRAERPMQEALASRPQGVAASFESAGLPRAECPMQEAFASRPQVVVSEEFESAGQRRAAGSTQEAAVCRPLVVAAAAESAAQEQA
jgi:hypothetical protein